MMALPPNPKPRITFLFSDTGGGHRSAAEAIIEAIHLEFPDRFETDMVDIFRQYAPSPLHLAPDIYPTLSKMPRVWGLGYRMSDGKRRTKFVYQMLYPYLKPSLQRLLQGRRHDLIVSVHQLVNTPVLRAMENRRIPFVTVVTDMVSTHAAWYHSDADMVIVATEEARQRGLEMGLRPNQIEVVGLPVADRFCHPVADKLGLRRELGWPEGRPVALLVGGGEGMGPLEQMALAIDAARLPVSLVIVAGRNKAMQARLEAHPWQIPVKVYGFVRQMPDFMRAADVLVTKAGPGTICEAFIAGLPIILYSRMPGQEDGNVTYVVQKGAGIWAPEPAEVVRGLRRWLDHPSQMRQAARISHNLARPYASRQIACLLAQQIPVPSGVPTTD
jgi:1,2-diacylglycerol 3-beta-galactosyltransferase